MNKMTASEDFSSAVPNVAPKSDAASRSYKYALADLHEIVTSETNKERLLPVLNNLIFNQASLHGVGYYGSEPALQKNIELRGNTFRGFVLYAESRMPIAYAIYYPMIDAEGHRAAYCEDAYVIDRFRGLGVMEIVFQQLAKRILDEGCEYMEWTTDKRNLPFQKFAKKIGAKVSGTTTIVGDALLSASELPENIIKKGWAQGNFETQQIQPHHIDLLKSLNIEPNIIRSTGDMPFKGFITFRTGDTRTPVAITPGWEHLSTFRVTPGIYLEHPTFADNVSEAEKAQIILSIIEPAKALASAQGKKMDYLRWHIKGNDSTVRNILLNELKLPVDCMEEPNDMDSELIVYKLSNGELIDLKNNAVKNSDQILKIARGAPIGPPVRPSSVDAQLQ